MIYVKIGGKWEKVSHWQPAKNWDVPGSLYEGWILWQKSHAQSMARPGEWLYEDDYLAQKNERKRNEH